VTELENVWNGNFFFLFFLSSLLILMYFIWIKDVVHILQEEEARRNGHDKTPLSLSLLVAHGEKIREGGKE
jgi:hypothetical protein